MEKIIARIDFEGERQHFDFGHTNFEMPVRAPGGDAE